MSFRTKLDFSDNRQVKQHIKTKTVLSGATSFGVPYVDLPSGPDFSTSSITQTVTSFTSTFSGNSTTTNYTWYDSRMSLANNVLSAITPTTSAYTQNTGQVYTGNSYTIIDDNTIYSSYSGVSFDISATTFINLGGGNYSGSVHTNTLIILSYNSLDFTGRTIWNDVSGITRTKDLIITNSPSPGFVWTCYDTEGKGSWGPVSAATTTDYWISGSTGIKSLKAFNGSGLDATGDYALAQGFNTKAIGYASHAGGNDTSVGGDYGFIHSNSSSISTGSTNSTILGGNGNIITTSMNSGIFGGSGNTITSSNNAIIIGSSNLTATTSNTTYTNNLIVPIKLSVGDYATSTASTRALNVIGTDAVIRVLRVSPTLSGDPSFEFISRTSIDGQNIAYWDAYVDGSENSFKIRERTVSNLDRLTVLSGGNVGIATTTPREKLHVSGNTLINGNLYVSGNTQSIFSGNSSLDLVRITQAGSGNAFVVEDSVNPDSTPFVITNAGSVGIGTLTPTETLDVSGTSRLRGIVSVGDFTNNTAAIEIGKDRLANGNAYLDLVGDTTYTDYGLRIIRNSGITSNSNSIIAHRGTGILSIGAQDAGSLQFVTNDTARMYIASGGSVGIGTTDPQNTLHIKGNAGILTLEGSNHVYMNFYPDGYSAGRKGWFGFGSSADDNITLTNQTVTGGTVFKTNDTARMFISASGNSGNVGIGTITPAELLDVNGTSRLRGIVKIGDLTSGDAAIEVGADRSFGGNAYIDLIGDTNYPDYGSRFIRYSGVSGNTVLAHRGSGLLSIGTQESGNLQFATNDVVRMYISNSGNSGNIGIGTTSPTEKLDVNGRTKTTTIQITSGATNGYVLTSDVNGVGRWGKAASDIFTTGSTNNNAIYDIIGSHTLSGVSNYSIIAGGYTNKISASTYSGIFAGTGNTVDTAGFSVIVGGGRNSIKKNTDNLTYPKYSGIFAGYNNTIIPKSGETGEAFAGSYSVISGGKNNTISGHTISFIGGGDNNLISCDSGWNAIIGGKNNINHAADSVIIGGNGNLLGTSTTCASNTDNSAIVGGLGNTISNSYDAVTVGGNTNYISNSDDATIVGGNINNITNSDNAVTVGGNTHIISNSNYSIIAGGGINKISGTTYSGIFAGQNNSISGLTVTSGSSTNTTIIGGQNNLIYNSMPISSLVVHGSSDNSSIIGGKNNSIYGHRNSIILGGTGNTIHFDFPTVYNNSESILGSLKCGISSSTVSNITASSGSTINGANQSSIIGGVRNSIESADNSVIIGGSGNMLGSAGSVVDNIVVIGCTNVIAQIDYMVYVPDLIIDGLISVTDLRTNASGQLIDGASDIRLKENINQLQNSLSILKNLRGVSFEYTQESNMGGGLRYGFIAQEVQEFIPDIVRSRVKGDGMLSLSYTEIIPLLVEAVKELASGQTTSNNTYLETQSILAEDNNIDLNHNGSVESAVGGGIRVINAIGIDNHAELITDTDGNFITNNDFKPNALTIPVYTPTSSNDINGNEGNITRDSDYLYIKCNNIWKRTKLEEF